MKSQYLPLVLLCCALAFLAGCGKDKKKKDTTKKGKQEVFTQVDIPTADGDTFLFDDIKGEFDKLNDNIDTGAVSADDFKWLEAEEVLQSEAFDVVHFAFDKSDISPDQEPLVKRNIALAKELLDGNGPEVNFVVEGHACSSAGSAAYNLALSEKRAKVERDRFVAAGVPQEKVKIVARGAEMPVLVNGAPLTGDRAAQGPNRRDEVRAIYS
jgi:outer membrane protein OmpA-like peptidoglycan-associated protein